MDAHDDIEDTLKLEFYDLMTKHRNYIYNFCCAFADTPDEVDELLYEIVMTIDQRFASCRADNERQRWRWAQRVIRSVAIDYWRRRLRHHTVPLSAAMSEPDDATARENRETFEELMAYLDGEQDREILRLIIQGYKYSEISVKMHLSEATVRQRVNRALKKMKTIKTKIYG